MKVKIIAEIGVNHNGKLDLAYKLIDLAKKSGADYAKFQLAIPENVVTLKAIRAPYQLINLKKKYNQFSLLKKIHFKLSDYYKIKKKCYESNIKFLASPFDIESLNFLQKKLKVNEIKIPSGEINNLPLLEKISKKNKNIFISTGMSSFSEIKFAIQVLLKNGSSLKNIHILQCNTSYPTPFEDVNLLAMNRIKLFFKTKVGYSDHTQGIEASIAAVGCGATVIEKHLTLDKKMKGPDHRSSLEPKEFCKLVSSIRNIEKTLYDKKHISKSEKKNIKLVRKSIVAKKNISKGEIFTENNITTKRPGTGISPIFWHKYINKRSKRNYKADELINE